MKEKAERIRKEFEDMRRHLGPSFSDEMVVQLILIEELRGLRKAVASEIDSAAEDVRQIESEGRHSLR